ncbi:ABC transporter substrate-binding protein [Olsenella sp. HMSC062G07]|uniref:ABC transporter substrate-binding protein n=1 Tax=Olsenella sp. HMSC062G07 TaxID=1739330 RepID=UPI0008A5DEBF|nr:ABC transporter substrate-binding protein [Olsenella sp. HMSC062G07]OFK24002.1 amino acid ABC transporter substrate-binding protein [Olsenella sp. HMSC062G07]
MTHSLSRRDLFKFGGLAAAGLGGASLLAGCGGTSASSSDKTIKIGVLGPFSGSVAQYGIACRNGAELYFANNPSIGDYAVELDEQDEKGDATEALNAYNKMVEDGVIGIIGDVTSTPSIAVAQASVADNLPCVTPSATAAEVISFGPNTFRACVTDPFQGKVMADFAQSQGWKSVGTIYNNGDDYSTGVNGAFVEEAGKKGISVPQQSGYQDGDVDFNSQLTTIISAGVDAIFCPNYYQDDGKIITQARQQGFSGPIFGVDGWSNIASGQYASAADLQNCYYCCSFVATNEDAGVQEFVKAYKEKFNEDPTNFCALGYDATNVLAQGIKGALDAGGDPAKDDFKQAVIDQIAKGKVQGVTGAISYDGTGDPVKSTLVISFDADGTEKVFTTIDA